jgi:hypothetical protein
MNCCNGDCNQGRDCPYRGTITMSEGNKQWGLGMVAGVIITSLIAIALSKMQPVQQVEMPKDVITAYNMGIKDALRTNPPSSDLEMSCLELWGKK